MRPAAGWLVVAGVLVEYFVVTVAGFDILGTKPVKILGLEVVFLKSASLQSVFIQGGRIDPVDVQTFASAGSFAFRKLGFFQQANGEPAIVTATVTTKYSA